MFHVVFVGSGMVMVTCSGSALSPPFSMFGIFLNSLILCLWIVANGLDACFGMINCLVFMALVIGTPGLLLFGDLASFHLERCLGAYPVDWVGWFLDSS